MGLFVFARSGWDCRPANAWSLVCHGTQYPLKTYAGNDEDADDSEDVMPTEEQLPSSRKRGRPKRSTKCEHHTSAQYWVGTRCTVLAVWQGVWHVEAACNFVRYLLLPPHSVA